MSPEEYAKQLLIQLARHFGLKSIPNVRVGCEGCPFYDRVRRRCSLGYIACYDPRSNTITISHPRYINELILTHELLHYVLSRRGGYNRIGIKKSEGNGLRFLSFLLMLIGLRIAVKGVYGV